MKKKWFKALKAQRLPDDHQPLEVEVRGAVVVQSAHGREGYAGVRNATLQWHPQAIKHARPKTVRSSRGGAFALRLGVGLYTVKVSPPAGYQPTTKVVRVLPNMKRTLLVLERVSADMPNDIPSFPDDTGRPPEGQGHGNLKLTLKVYGRDGWRTFPLGAAKIQIHGRKQTFMTDKAGRLFVPLPAGKYNVVVTKSGFNMVHRQVVLSARNTIAPTIYLDRQPSGGGGGIRPPGEGQTPPLQHSMPLQIHVVVSFPKPAKKGRPAGWTTSPAKGANIRIMQGRRQVFSGRADKNGYLGTKLGPGNYQIQVSHGNLRQNESVNMGRQTVRKTITLRSGAALMTIPGSKRMTPKPGSSRIVVPGLQNNRGRIVPGIQQLQQRVQ